MIGPLPFRLRPKHVASLFCGLCALPACSQAIPAVNAAPEAAGFQLPETRGSLSYALSIAGRYTLGNSSAGGNYSSGSFSGDLAYLSSSDRAPFSLIYTGGYLANSGTQPSSSFHALALSQQIIYRKWTILAADSVQYTPNTPAAGFSGIPGIGDLGIAPVSVGSGIQQESLILNSKRLNNTATVTLQRGITPRFFFDGEGSYRLERFIDSPPNSGLEDNLADGGVGFHYLLDRRTTVGVSASYAHFTYQQTPFHFDSESVQVKYTRQLTRRLLLYAAIGPQYTTSSDQAYAPNSLNAAVDAKLAYQVRRAEASVSYQRMTNSGTGLTAGARSDSVQFMIGRPVNRFLNLSAGGGYLHSSSLGNSQLPQAGSLNGFRFSSQTFTASFQATRQLTRTISGYGSYTVQHQSVSGALAVAGFSGYINTVAAGLTYSPQQRRIGH